MAGISLEEITQVCGEASLVNTEGSSSELRIVGISHDSRLVAEGDLFACIPGTRSDGHAHAAEALMGGAAALLVERRLEYAVPQILVSDVRKVIGPVAATVYGNPSNSMRVVGVTGTAGKTTTVHALAEALEACGAQAGVIGTLDGGHTTPEAPEMQRALASMRDSAKEWACVEVSSHGLDFGRVEGVEFAATVFTNLSAEHLDFHKDMEAYYQAKRRLFHKESQYAIISIIDDWGKRLVTELKGLGHEGLVVVDPEMVQSPKLEADGSTFVWRGHQIKSALLGKFNLLNLLIAGETLRAFGWDEDAIAQGLERVSPVKGRMEPVVVPDSGVAVVVDYSHKPQALAEALKAVRDLSGGRVWVVFGAGGERDAAKRPLMGEIAGTLADEIVITSDNPRSESAEAIAKDIVTGIGSGGTHYRVVLDRAEAIHLAIRDAEIGDIVLVAGKGHETHQIVGEQRRPFDDVSVSNEALLSRIGSSDG
ncbi:MAG: UDP-N-acetylmuramoyl-L-alanyl-D-glutamate--2,6-diaminopimelate ligase [Acidimicrobiales bacterium]|nr:UDP-N-acetylmuramoyl-L-alanyl-D-glutamate--2,6-diaminopimelate ligase [Acidimicrobiales bacterium]